MINLFIDTNIWLNLYDCSDEKLQSFRDLYLLLNKEIKLYRNSQLKDEIIRNRDDKIKKSISALSISKINFPSFSQEYEEYSEIKKAQNDLCKDFNEWKKKIVDDASNHKLKADKVIDEFFGKDIDTIDNDIIDKAITRHHKGNPPGKKNDCLGDAINWEYLLDSVEEGEDLHIITEDSDYQSLLDDEKIHYFLEREWRERKKACIYLYKSLNAFIKAQSITKISEEAKINIEKDSLIEDLSHSLSFAETHSIISQLSNYTDWNYQQISLLCNIAINNSQVGGIIGDEDVSNFYRKILSIFDFSDTEDYSIRKVYQMIYSSPFDCPL